MGMVLIPMLLAVASAGAQGLPSGCAALALPSRACVDTAGGIVLAGTPARASALAAIASEGEARFRTRFARPGPRYAVVEMDAATVDAVLDARLEAAGYQWRLPWLSEAAMTGAYRDSVTRAVETKAKAMALDPARTEQLKAAALSQQAARLDPVQMRERERGALPHELGHGWFIRAWWPATERRASGDHYGGPAPDWMDEVAAVLMESDAMAQGRRTRFASIHDGTDAAAKARLLDLATFLSGGHPALPVLDLAKSGGGGAGGVRVLTGAEAAGVAAAAGDFYLQARLFADYVLDRSGDPAAFRTAAAAFAAGRTTAKWLATDGAKLRLPGTVAGVESDWRAWLEAR